MHACTGMHAHTRPPTHADSCACTRRIAQAAPQRQSLCTAARKPAACTGMISPYCMGQDPRALHIIVESSREAAYRSTTRARAEDERLCASATKASDEAARAAISSIMHTWLTAL